MIVVQNREMVPPLIPLPAATVGFVPLRWRSSTVAGVGIGIAYSPRTAARRHIGIADEYILADARPGRHHVQSHRRLVGIIVQSLVATATADECCWHMRIFRRRRARRRMMWNKGMRRPGSGQVRRGGGQAGGTPARPLARVDAHVPLLLLPTYARERGMGAAKQQNASGHIIVLFARRWWPCSNTSLSFE